MQPPDFKNPYNVILIGEFHERDEDQVSSTVRSFLDRIGFECLFTLYREQINITDTILDLGNGSQIRAPILPLEEGGVEFDQCNLYNSIAKESFPSVLTGVFNLLQFLSILMYFFWNGTPIDSCSTPGVGNKLPASYSTDIIKNFYFDVLANIERTNPIRIKLQSLFARENDLVECLNDVQNPVNKKKLVELFKIIHGRYVTMLKGTQYEQHRLKEYRAEININGTREYLLVPIPSADNGPKTMGLLRHLQLDRDKLMVANLKKSIDDELVTGGGGVAGGGGVCSEGGVAGRGMAVAGGGGVCSGGGVALAGRGVALAGRGGGVCGGGGVAGGGAQIPRVNVVIVGNDHFVNMKMLLSEASFRVIYENHTREKPQKFSMVEIRDLKSKPELNGLTGIIYDSGRVDPDGNERWPIFVEMFESGRFMLKNIIIKHDNFEVRRHNLPKSDFVQLFPNTHAEAAKKLGKPYIGGGRKHHRKHSTRRSKTTKHHIKHSTKRSKSTKRHFKRTKISTIM